MCVPKPKTLEGEVAHGQTRFCLLLSSVTEGHTMHGQNKTAPLFAGECWEKHATSATTTTSTTTGYVIYLHYHINITSISPGNLTHEKKSLQYVQCIMISVQCFSTTCQTDST